MAISRIPTESTPEIKKVDEKKAEDFINGAVKPPMTKPSGKTVVNVKFDTALLEKIDSAADKMGINRTAWLHVASNEKLKE